MTDYKGILRLSALGIAKQDIAAACKCSRNTVRNVLNAADKSKLSWDTAKSHSNEQLKALLFPTAGTSPLFKMPDYEYVHREMQKSGVTLSLLWVEYCEKCRQNQEIPYKSTQFNKYYADYVHKTKATMHLEYKPGDTMQVDWAGQTARIIDTYTGEDIDVYIFVSVLAHSGYAYVEGFLDMKQESWITAHVNAYHFYEGVTRILTPDNLKTGIIKNTREGVEVNRSYLEMAEHYGTAVIPARPRSPKDKALVENSVGIISTWILAALRSRQFFTLQELNEVIQEKLYDFNHKSFQKKEGSRATVYNIMV